jgi:hypothetical protein
MLYSKGLWLKIDAILPILGDFAVEKPCFTVYNLLLYLNYIFVTALWIAILQRNIFCKWL